MRAGARYVAERACRHGAGAILLDLSRTPCPGRRQANVSLMRESFALAGRGGAEVLARVSTDPAIRR